MLMNWLEPAIVEGLNKVITDCERINKEGYDEFSAILICLNLKLQDVDREKLTDLENLYIQKNVCLEEAYRRGFDDGINILRFVKNADSE